MSHKLFVITGLATSNSGNISIEVHGDAAFELSSNDEGNPEIFLSLGYDEEWLILERLFGNFCEHQNPILKFKIDFMQSKLANGKLSCSKLVFNSRVHFSTFFATIDQNSFLGPISDENENHQRKKF